MFFTEIHLQPDRHAFNRNDTCKSAMILHNLAQAQILFLFFAQSSLCEILPSVT